MSVTVFDVPETVLVLSVSTLRRAIDRLNPQPYGERLTAEDSSQNLSRHSDP